MITSTGNPQVRAAAALAKKAKARKEQGLFIVEGAKLFGEAPPDRVEKVFVTDAFLKQNEKLLFGSRCEVVSEDVMKYMSDTQTPQGILAVVRQFSYKLSDILCGGSSSPAHLLVLETLQDPGNLGTILRAGEGAGITGVVMDQSTADIYNPKVIRSTMGAVYRVPFTYVEDLKDTLLRIKEAGICLYAAHLKGEKSYDEEDYTGNTGFLIGNESSGLSHSVADMADSYIKIPMLGRVESLNAAVAASILMFETARQRRIKKK